MIRSVQVRVLGRVARGAQKNELKVSRGESTPAKEREQKEQKQEGTGVGGAACEILAAGKRGREKDAKIHGEKMAGRVNKPNHTEQEKWENKPE